MAVTVLLMPGINNSGPTHWQSLWEKEAAQKTDQSVQQDQTLGWRRIEVPDWDRPVCSQWVDAIDRHVSGAGGPVVIVAHSLGCLAVSAWVDQAPTGAVQGAMFVSIPDPQGPAFPAEASGFRRPLPGTLKFPSIVVSSTNDPYGSPEYAGEIATAWGSRFVSAGAKGHINADSGLGDWREGQRLLETLLG